MKTDSNNKSQTTYTTELLVNNNTVSTEIQYENTTYSIICYYKEEDPGSIEGYTKHIETVNGKKYYGYYKIEDSQIQEYQIIPDENYRSIVEENSSKSFKDYDYDVVDYKSGEGEKIDKYINQNYKVNNNYPKALYFKNSKIVLEESFYNVVEDYQEFVKNIND